MQTDKEHLERFILNNPELEQLEGMLEDFNLFETLNLVRAEIRHSNVLAWLLNPGGNHGLGSYFLHLFLKHFVSINKAEIEDLDVFDVEMLSYSNVEIRREWKNLDILVVIQDERQQVVLAIENKITSQEHSQQLTRYRQEVEKDFPAYKKLFLYLTPESSIPSDEFWCNFNYSTISDLVEQLLVYKKSQIGEQVYAFIEQYNKILKRYIVGNSEVEQICKLIYKKHKAALDLIFQYRPDILAEISEYIQQLIGNHPDVVLDSAAKTSIRFSTAVFDNKVPPIAEGWLKSNRFLVYEFYNYENRLALRLYIAPGPAASREALYHLLSNNQNLFQRTRYSLNKKYHCVYQKEFLGSKDFENKEFSDLVEVIDKKWKDFSENQLKEIDDFILNNDLGFLPSE